MGQQHQHDRRAGQMNMFGGGGGESAQSAAQVTGDALPNVPELASADLLKFEKELLGFYITSHPLTEHQNLMDRYTTATTREAMNCAEGVEVMIGGMLSAVRPKVAKTGRSAGKRWAILEIEDLEGKIEGMCFAESYEDISTRYPGVLSAEQIVFVRGKVDKKRETPSLMINDVMPINVAIERLTTSIGVKLDRNGRYDFGQLKDVLKKHAGKKELFVQVQAADGSKVSLKINVELGVRVTRDLVDDLEMLLGNGSVQLGGEGQRRLRRIQQQQLFKEEPSALEAPSDEMVEMEVAADVE
jgi:DNA polymerase-3 subunit alpha